MSGASFSGEGMYLLTLLLDVLHERKKREGGLGLWLLFFWYQRPNMPTRGQ